MPYTNTRRGVYVTNSTEGTIKHGIPAIVNGVGGIAIKQKPRSWSEGLSVADKIDEGEVYFLQTHGEVQVGTASGEAANGLTLSVGTKVYIAAASTTDGVTTYALSTSASSTTYFGRVTETPTSPAHNSTYRVPAGKVRIDLDLKA